MGESVCLPSEATKRKSGANSLSTSVLPPVSSLLLDENQLLIQPHQPVAFGFAERFVLRATSVITRSIGESVDERTFKASIASSRDLNCCTLMLVKNFRHWSV